MSQNEGSMKVAISETFTKSLQTLDKTAQKPVEKLIGKIRNVSDKSTLAMERLNTLPKNIKVMRVNVNLRLAVLDESETNTLVLLYVGQHDDVYSWLERRKINFEEALFVPKIVE